MVKNNLYEDKQRFTPIWICILLFIIGLYLIYRTYQQLFLNIPLGDSPMTNSGLILFVFIILGVFYFFSILSLKLEIKDEYIVVNFFPIHRKIIRYKNIENIELINYKTIGSGIRFSLKYGTVYRVKGNKGLNIELKNGDKILIGFQNENKVKTILSCIKKSCA